MSGYLKSDTFCGISWNVLDCVTPPIYHILKNELLHFPHYKIHREALQVLKVLRISKKDLNLS